VSSAPAQTPGPQAWVSKTSGLLYKVTLDADRVTAEKVFPLDVQARLDETPFVRCEYSGQDGVWVGKCSARLPLQDSRQRIKWCSFKFSSRITSLTPEKIEGESDVWSNEDVDVDHCAVKKSHAQHFVWVPKKITGQELRAAPGSPG